MTYSISTKNHTCKSCGLTLTKQELFELREKNRQTIETAKEEKDNQRKEYLEWWLNKDAPSRIAHETRKYHCLTCGEEIRDKDIENLEGWRGMCLKCFERDQKIKNATCRRCGRQIYSVGGGIGTYGFCEECLDDDNTHDMFC